MMLRTMALAPLLALTACGSAAPNPLMVGRPSESRWAGHDVRTGQRSAEDEGRGATARREDAAGETSSRAAKADGTGDPPLGAKGLAEAPVEERPASLPYEEMLTTLRAAEGGLHSCRDDEGPRSFGVVLRFETTGKVGRVDVTPPNGAAAACVRRRLSEITVMPFSGEPVSVRMSVRP